MKLFFIILFFSVNIGYAFVTDKIMSDDTIESIAKRNIDRVSVKYGDSYKNYEADIKTWNSNITDWQHPPKNQLIYVDYPYDHYALGSKWAPALGKEGGELDHNFSLSTFYAASFGSYNEQTKDQTIKSGQNFPVTLGVGFSSTTDERKHFILGSAYFAQSSKGNVTGNNTKAISSFSIPGEVGFNFYYQYFIKENLLGIYSGYDYEKLNTFNTSEIVLGKPILNIDNKIQYATVGFSQGAVYSDIKLNLKASVSKTFSSTTTGSKSLTGMKYIMFFMIKPEGRFSFNMFYKHHDLKGPTQLSINRIGFSIGFLIF